MKKVTKTPTKKTAKTIAKTKSPVKKVTAKKVTTTKKVTTKKSK